MLNLSRGDQPRGWSPGGAGEASHQQYSEKEVFMVTLSAVTIKSKFHWTSLSEESLALFVQLTLSLFPLLKTQYNVLARGLTLPSLGK